MHFFTYHIVGTSYLSAIKASLFNSNLKEVEGLIHGELMFQMTLGAPVYSKERIHFNKLAFVGQW